jgi:SAM-dependent MidA family methyltransferase
MSLERESERGRLAADVLKNEVYVEAYTKLETEIIEKWREARSTQDREQLHQMLLLLAKVQRALESVMSSGKVADAEIQRRSLKDKIGRVLRAA